MQFDTENQKKLFEAVIRQTKAQTQSNLDNVSQTVKALDELLASIGKGTVLQECTADSCSSKISLAPKPQE